MCRNDRRPTPVISDRNRLDTTSDRNLNYNIAEVVNSGNSNVDVYVDSEAVARARQAQRQRQTGVDIDS